MAQDGTPRRPRKNAQISGDFEIPEIITELRQRIGSSPIDEFVLAHGAADVFRELIQNEFDADGSEIGIRFTDTQLEITGAGRAIMAKGWARLSVLIGTGEVLGDDSGETIAPKESSIGSKNLGMRSLFRFGDRIHVRSNGRMAVLDLREFVVGRQTDPATKGRKGVLIQVPYRATPLRKFLPFTEVREAADLEDIERVLFPTLVKLALTGRRKGVRAMTITSDRIGRSLHWRQETATERSSLAGISVVRRNGRLQVRNAHGARSRQDHEEIEFSRLVDVPSVHAGLDFPTYYRSGDQLRIGVSLALKGGKPIADQIGYCYYPLQARQARTGCAVSISAPYQLDAERTRLIETEWNDWLNNQAAELVADLVGSDWFGRFGRAAYDVALRQGTEERTFADLVFERLKARPCWPSAERTYGVAADLVVPTFPALNGHLAAKNYLHPDLAGDEAIAELAVRCGAKRFTVNSLVRMRCGGETSEGLETKLTDGEANYRYTPHPGQALDPEEQHSTAGALTQLYRRLSPQNRRDLRLTRSTLSATCKLEAAEKLIRVSPDMWDTCPEPDASRLHPILYDDLAVARHCRPFDLTRWIEEAAGRAASGEITEAEQEALYRQLLLPDAKLSSRLVGVIRRSPVLKDDKGNWARPDALAILPARDACLLEQVVRAPALEVRQRPDLLDRLAIRRKIASEDLIAMAKATEARLELAEPFEELLRRQQALITPKLTRALSEIAFLRNRAGGLSMPSRIHPPTGINLICLSDTALLLEDKAVYRRLGCPARPGSALLLDALERARDAGAPPPAPQHLYPALVEALRTERRSLSDFENEPILSVDGAYATPHATLVAPRPPRCLQEALPVVRRAGAVAEAYLALGASASPKTHHWLAFFQWLDARASAVQGRAPAADRALLREAYRHLSVSGLPPELAPTMLCLLSAQGILHSLDDLQSGRFVEDDYPELAQALMEANADIAFGDHEEASRIVFRRLGIRPLSERCGEGRVAIGPPAAHPNWFQSKTAAAALAQLHRPDLAHGITELAYAHQKQNPDFQPARTGLVSRRLLAIDKIAFAGELQRAYQLGRRVSVPADSAIEAGVLYLRPPRYRSEYDHILALELARLAGAARLADVRALSSSILPLLQAGRPAEVFAYLRRLGIRPTAWGYADEAVDAELEEAEITREEIAQNLMASVHIAPPSSIAPAPIIAPSPSPPPPPPTPASPRPLVSLDQVRLSIATPEGQAPPPSHGGGYSGGWRGSYGFTPRTAAEIERDREIGHRGEALVFRQEIERVRELGYENPNEHVIWVSQANPGADHDIRSVDQDGGPIWIEVKSTTGTDGRFDWSIAEFEKALREGPRYQLWRVYDAAGETPVAKCFGNPAALIRTPAIRLEISSLRAFVEAR